MNIYHQEVTQNSSFGWITEQSQTSRLAKGGKKSKIEIKAALSLWEIP